MSAAVLSWQLLTALRLLLLQCWAQRASLGWCCCGACNASGPQRSNQVCDVVAATAGAAPAAVRVATAASISERLLLLLHVSRLLLLACRTPQCSNQLLQVLRAAAPSLQVAHGTSSTG
jgi:hypothetical protein